MHREAGIPDGGRRPPPTVPAMSFPDLVPDPAGLDAARHLLQARHHLDEAAAAVGLAQAVPWESPAADELRATLGALRALLDDDRAALDELRRLAAGRLT